MCNNCLGKDPSQSFPTTNDCAMYERVLYIQHRSSLWKGEGENDRVAPHCAFSPFTSIRTIRRPSSVDPPGRPFGLWTTSAVHTPDSHPILALS
uniref:Uncharacterized protein n=1 Tax=Pyxicephalus adspersus TaxID=30357 RepID=A0AAV3A9H3_PYXAD|nr:TPA: hypothetical protein GDO54_010306 [Pyxicephalus adspersus]